MKPHTSTVRGFALDALARSLFPRPKRIDDEHAPEATFESDGSEDLPEPGEYTAALTLNYAVDDGTGVSHLEPLVIENVKFKVAE